MLFYESERSDQHNYLYCQRDHNFNFPAHLHHSFEFLCVQSGTLACTLETEQYEVHPGEALLVLPDREFSEQENRYLTQFKAPTLDSFFGENGQFMADFEKYVNDQFPLRDQWIQLKAWSERLLGKQENNKVYFGTDGQTLFAQFNALPDEALAERVDYVNQLADNVIVPV